MRTTILYRGNWQAVSLIEAGQGEVSGFLFLISQLKLFLHLPGPFLSMEQASTMAEPRGPAGPWSPDSLITEPVGEAEIGTLYVVVWATSAKDARASTFTGLLCVQGIATALCSA